MTDRQKSEPVIDRGKWLAALEATAPVDDQEAMTSREIGALLGLQRSAAKDRIAKLVTGGKARTVRKRITDSEGRPQWVQAYRLVK